MTTIKKIIYTYICDGCDKRIDRDWITNENLGYPPTGLPIGWEKISAKDFCAACVEKGE